MIRTRAWIAVLLCANVLATELPDRREDIAFFETRIRPLLAEHCYECHSSRSKKLQGDLLLDRKDAVLRGGESGPAIDLDNSSDSLLLRAVRYEDLEMPPSRRLSRREIELLTEWVRRGVPFPGTHSPTESRERARVEISEKDRQHWAYQPIKVRPLNENDSARSPIDHYVQLVRSREKLTAAPRVTKRELIRRAYYDLHGLPPSVQQVRQFQADNSPDAFSELVDQLLASPRYGERWARHWLDVVRFGQTNGYERDDEKPLAWRYRDYVIDVFNRDVPFDRFVREQLAGDELPDATANSIAATAFYRLGVWDDEPDDSLVAEFDGLDDMLSTIGQVFLGQTIGCARCHDHMFDPIPQRDYYELLSFIRNVRSYEKPKYELGSSILRPFVAPEELNRWIEDRDDQIRRLEQQRAALPDGAHQAATTLEEKIKQLREKSPPFPWTLAVQERGPDAPDTRLLVRGNVKTPTMAVEPRFLTILGNVRPNVSPLGHRKSTGRRLALAHWIASEENPLTARVIVNRVWQHHFGRGIVETSNDFGQAGIPPTHPELLDWLAADFVRHGWSIKRLHRKIMASDAYQMSARHQDQRGLAVDSGNRLLWRQNLRRLDAEALRDSVLEVSGQLNNQMAGRGVFPDFSGEVVAGQSRPGLGWEKSTPPQRARRSIYTFIKRGLRDPLVEAFDYVNTTSPLGVRPTTTVAPQSLMMLNSRFMQDNARQVANQIWRQSDRPDEQVNLVFERILKRRASDAEIALGRQFLRKQSVAFETIQHQISFHPDVPPSLSSAYRSHLAAEDYLRGPRGAWRYNSGRWGDGYEGIDVVDQRFTPFAIWQGEHFRDAQISGRLKLAPSTEHARLLLRCREEGDQWHGLAIRFGSREGSVTLENAAGAIDAPLSWDAVVSPDCWHDFRVSMVGDRVQFFLDNDSIPVFDWRDPAAAPEGEFGISTWGGSLTLDGLSVDTSSRTWNVAASTFLSKDQENAGQQVAAALRKPDTPSSRALQLFCLVVLNSNEFVYLD